MSPQTIGLIGIGVLLVLMFVRMPISLAMAFVGIMGTILLRGAGPALDTLKSLPFYTINGYNMSTVLFFVLMGQLAFQSEMSSKLYNFANVWFGWLKGGLAVATIVACAFFAALCGSSLAGAATMGAVALPEMKKLKYSDSLATGAVAAGGTLGILIPPSVAMVVYGILVEESIGKLLIAGIIPGVTLALIFAITTYILCNINPKLGAPAPKTTMKEKLTSLSGVWAVLIVFVGMFGGLYAGVFTPSEAGAAGAAIVTIIALVQKKLSWPRFKGATAETLKIAGMIFMILIGAFLFSPFLAFSKLPFVVADFFIESNMSPYVAITCIILMYFVLGCFMDSLAMTVLTVPFIYPLIDGMGFDLIWFGVIIVLMTEIGQITPPFGINVFVVHGVAQDVPIKEIFKGIVPYLFGMIIMVILLIIFPDIALFLPQRM